MATNILSSVHRLPDELALKIYAEYLPAPDRPSDDCYFNISINQQVDGKIWVYMVTFVALDGEVTPTSSRSYPRALEHALSNIAFSIETTLLHDSDIEFRSNNNCCLGTAGMIGPLTKRQDRCRGCNERRFTSLSIVSKYKEPLQESRKNSKESNIDYLQGLIQRSLDKVQTRNRILVHLVLDGNEINRRVLWIRLRKPVFPLWKILSKHYNDKVRVPYIYIYKNI